MGNCKHVSYTLLSWFYLTGHWLSMYTLYVFGADRKSKIATAYEENV
jgi:hypothetical protein